MICQQKLHWITINSKRALIISHCQCLSHLVKVDISWSYGNFQKGKISVVIVVVILELLENMNLISGEMDKEQIKILKIETSQWQFAIENSLNSFLFQIWLVVWIERSVHINNEGILKDKVCFTWNCEIMKCCSCFWWILNRRKMKSEIWRYSNKNNYLFEFLLLWNINMCENQKNI